MECKLDFVWLSDPLLQYALYLTGFFILGIVGCMVLIAHKFQSHHTHQVKQAHATELIQELLKAGKPNSLQIDAFNQFIQKHPIDACYAIVRVLENASPSIDLRLFKDIQVKETIDRSLASFFHKNHAIAIEAIGLLKQHDYRATLLRYLDDPSCCSFAAEALVRLDGMGAVSTILTYYQQKSLTTSQVLTGLVQLSPNDLQDLQADKSSIALPAEFIRYLRAS
jgi:hypothetical protein